MVNFLSQEAYVSSWAVCLTVLQDQMGSTAPLLVPTVGAVTNMLDQIADVFKELSHAGLVQPPLDELQTLRGLRKAAKYLKRVGQAFLVLDAATGMSMADGGLDAMRLPRINADESGQSCFASPELHRTLYPVPGSRGSPLWDDAQIASPEYAVEYDQVVSNMFGPLFNLGCELEALKKGRKSAFWPVGEWSSRPADDTDVFISAFVSTEACTADLWRTRHPQALMDIALEQFRAKFPSASFLQVGGADDGYRQLLEMATTCKRQLKPDFFSRLVQAARKAMSRALSASLAQADCWSGSKIIPLCKPFKGATVWDTMSQLHRQRSMDPSASLHEVVMSALQRMMTRRAQAEIDSPRLFDFAPGEMAVAQVNAVGTAAHGLGVCDETRRALKRTCQGDEAAVDVLTGATGPVGVVDLREQRFRANTHHHRRHHRKQVRAA